jgi:hypothetical protein
MKNLILIIIIIIVIIIYFIKKKNKQLFVIPAPTKVLKDKILNKVYHVNNNISAEHFFDRKYNYPLIPAKLTL